MINIHSMFTNENNDFQDVDFTKTNEKINKLESELAKHLRAYSGITEINAKLDSINESLTLIDSKSNDNRTDIAQIGLWNKKITEDILKVKDRFNLESIDIRNKLDELDRFNLESIDIRNKLDELDRFNLETIDIRKKLDELDTIPRKSVVQIACSAEIPFAANSYPFNFTNFQEGFTEFCSLRGGRILSILMQTTCIQNFHFRLEDREGKELYTFRKTWTGTHTGLFYIDRSPVTPIEFKYGDKIRVKSLNNTISTGHIAIIFLIEYDMSAVPTDRGSITKYEFDDATSTINIESHPLPDE